jgi:uncharacterized protein (DUF849 family)
MSGQVGHKVVVTCAVTGSIHTPSMSPHLPITPTEIAEQAVQAAEAGAAILHLHVRDPLTGRPSPDATVFADIVAGIRDRTDAIINITTGGSSSMSIEERLRAPLTLRPEMCSLNMGTMNFGLFPMASKPRHWRFNWEVPFLQATHSGMFKNTFADIEDTLRSLGDHGARFEFECYDVGHLYTLAYYAERRLVTPPFFVQTIFGVLGGIGATVADVCTMRATADRLFGREYEWSVLGAGQSQMTLGTVAAAMGAHVRVGLEDNLWLERGRLATSNAEQVAKITRILQDLSLEIATPAEARRLVGIPTSRAKKSDMTKHNEASHP